MDPLSLLRDFVVDGNIDRVIVEGDLVDFDGRVSFSITDPVYKSEQGKGDFYPLGDLLFYAQRLHQKFTDYIKAAKAAGRKQVAFFDRKDLQDYLTGKIDSAPGIQVAVPDLGGVVDHHEPSAKRPRAADGDADMMMMEGVEPSSAAASTAPVSAISGITGNERRLRDRNSVLGVPGKSFIAVVRIVDKVATQWAAEINRRMRGGGGGGIGKSGGGEMSAGTTSTRLTSRYQRETETDAKMKHMGAQELGIQSVGFAAAPGNAAAASGGATPSNVTQTAAPTPTASAGGSLSAHQEEQYKRGNSTPGVTSGSRPPSSSAPASGRKRPSSSNAKDLFQSLPIILVPAATSSLFNLYNIGSFLEKGKFITVEEGRAMLNKQIAQLPKSPSTEEEKRKVQEFMHKDARRGSILIERVVRNNRGQAHKRQYVVMDKEPAAGSDDWKRVVGVVCLGKPWQFKTWPQKYFGQGIATGNMAETFHKVCGVYFHYTDDKVGELVKGWNVKRIGLNRSSRHHDITAFQDFWKHMEEFLAARRKKS